MVYGTLERAVLPGKTDEGLVTHNNGMGQGTEAAAPAHPRADQPNEIMPNELLIQPETDSQAVAALTGGVELDVRFGVPAKEKPLWIDLYESFLDVFFPVKLPPLELTSTPIPVPDRMAVKANPYAFGTAAIINGSILAILLAVGVGKVIEQQKKNNLTITPVDVSEFKSQKVEQIAHGGGGAPDKAPPIQGKVPPRMQAIDMKPKIDQPALPSIDVAKDITIPDDSKLPNFGMAKSSNVKVASGGNGSGFGMGSGHGNGYGDGSGGGTGGGVYRPGGGVSAPVLLRSVDAEFSEEARRNKYQGIVLVNVIVDAQGNVQNPRVARSLGMGLDEKAVEAVLKYKFKPCRKDGMPVSCTVPIEIDFHIY